MRFNRFHEKENALLSGRQKSVFACERVTKRSKTEVKVSESSVDMCLFVNNVAKSRANVNKLFSKKTNC